MNGGSWMDGQSTSPQQNTYPAPEIAGLMIKASILFVSLNKAGYETLVPGGCGTLGMGDTLTSHEWYSSLVKPLLSEETCEKNKWSTTTCTIFSGPLVGSTFCLDQISKHIYPEHPTKYHSRRCSLKKTPANILPPVDYLGVWSEKNFTKLCGSANLRVSTEPSSEQRACGSLRASFGVDN